VAELFKETENNAVDSSLKQIKEMYDRIIMTDSVDSDYLETLGFYALVSNEVQGGDEESLTLAQKRELNSNITKDIVAEINTLETEVSAELTDGERAKLAFKLIGLTDIFTSLTSTDLELLNSIYLKSHNPLAVSHSVDHIDWVCELEGIDGEVICTMIFNERITRDNDTYNQFQELVGNIKSSEDIEHAIEFARNHVNVISIMFVKDGKLYSPLLKGKPSIIDFEVETV
jgi:hypothetical protein